MTIPSITAATFLAVVVTGFVLSRCKPNSKTDQAMLEQVSGPVARDLVKNGALLLDVRTRHEFKEKHLEGALNIPVGELETRISELPKDITLVIYCQSGRRSRKATQMLLRNKHQAKDLGGIDSWHST